MEGRPIPRSLRRAAAVLLVLAAAGGPVAAEDDPLAEAAALLGRVAPLVEEACGAKFVTPPVVKVVPEADAAAAFGADLAPQIARLYPAARPGQVRALVVASADASVKSCVARYSPLRKAILLVRSGFARQAGAAGFAGEGAGSLLLSALAHEGVHALDDQRFDLGRLYLDAPDREALRAVSMVTEGRATLFGGRVAERLAVPKEIRDRRPGGDEPAGAREAFLRLTYEGGAEFVAALLARGGATLADRALADPPRLTHHLFHPERWPDGGHDERPAAALAAVFPAAKPEILSELELRARYADLDGLEAARGLFAGYRGGAQVIVEETNVAALAFDTEEAAERFLVRSRREVPAVRQGPLVLRAAGPAAAGLVDRLRPAGTLPK